MINLNVKIETLIEEKAPDFQIAKAIKMAIKEYLSSLILIKVFVQSRILVVSEDFKCCLLSCPITTTYTFNIDQNFFHWFGENECKK